MTKWALTVLLVLTAPIAFGGAATIIGMVGELAAGRSVGNDFSLIPLILMMFLPGWVAALVWTVRLFQAKAATGKAGAAVSALSGAILSVGVILIAFIAIVIVLWSRL